ncbi:hypothetical protein NTE_00149 [Candidatus Nitrososphaera evergladensis SR1]|uniref:Uncharacterized protein n=1 Tax=Candidatus Nitrososphaera evergladensis SR1 TaxID=1459636 RepID=A0A075MLD8_9ARCH|nr:hypothetical protein [Candidatus Nitrososphaera evergladensis]AIF82231.1 hypothetical protein NTE_00149 [Candidatus Nitrososphaera evergladensis SR1]
MNDKAKVFSAAIAAVLVSAIVAGSFSVAKSYAQNPIQDLIGNATKAGKSLVGNVTGSGNQTSTTGNQTGNQTATTGNQTGTAPTGNQTGLKMQDGRLTGRIASIQQEANKPAWILAGIWKLEEVKSNATAATGGNATVTAGNATVTTQGNATVTTDGNKTTVTGNATSMTGQNNTSTSAGSNLSFVAKIEMVRPDGTAPHEHEVSDLKVTQIKNDESGNPTINGTVTVTMSKGPVQDVPVTIKIIGNSAIAMTLGPDKIDNHFGTEPIYGTVAKERG